MPLGIIEREYVVFLCEYFGYEPQHGRVIIYHHDRLLVCVEFLGVFSGNSCTSSVGMLGEAASYAVCGTSCPLGGAREGLQ